MELSNHFRLKKTPVIYHYRAKIVAFSYNGDNLLICKQQMVYKLKGHEHYSHTGISSADVLQGNYFAGCHIGGREIVRNLELLHDVDPPGITGKANFVGVKLSVVNGSETN